MKILNTDQIAILDFDCRLKVAQRRLTKLYESKKVKRLELKSHQPLCYYVSKKAPELVEHTIMTNWMYIYYRQREQEKNIFHFSYEQQNEILRYDGFIGINNGFVIRFCFIEVDLSNNSFDKVKKYNEYYQRKLYEKEWWFNYARGFPAIMILTHREEYVKEKVKKENVEGLEFVVKGMDLVDELRRLVK